jgi:hypothetical protein
MITAAGREPADEDYNHCLKIKEEEARLDASWEEGAEQFLLDNQEWIASMLASMQAEKRAAVLKREKQIRLKRLADAIAPILARRPNMTNKQVWHELKKKHPDTFGSDNTVRLIGQVRRTRRK